MIYREEAYKVFINGQSASLEETEVSKFLKYLILFIFTLIAVLSLVFYFLCAHIPLQFEVLRDESTGVFYSEDATIGEYSGKEYHIFTENKSGILSVEKIGSRYYIHGYTSSVDNAQIEIEDVTLIEIMMRTPKG